MSVTAVESTGSFYLRVSTFVYTYVGSYQFVTVLLLAVQEVEDSIFTYLRNMLHVTKSKHTHTLRNYNSIQLN